MRSFELEQLDVFTDRPLEGNPLAVFPDATGLDAQTMHAIAKEMNLSETVFVLPSEDGASDARVRSSRRSTSCRSRVTPRSGRHASSRAAPASARFACTRMPESFTCGVRTTGVSDIAHALGVSQEALLPGVDVVAAGSGGVAFLYVAMRCVADVDAASLDAAAMQAAAGDAAREVFIYARSGENRVHSRMFAPLLGIPEDPATGSASGPLAILLRRTGLISGGDPVEAISEQGTKMGRRSTIYLRSYADGRIDIGGNAVTVMAAELTID